eukprot:9319928-Karenia_brevis.AAC.1
MGYGQRRDPGGEQNGVDDVSDRMSDKESAHMEKHSTNIRLKVEEILKIGIKLGPTKTQAPADRKPVLKE